MLSQKRDNWSKGAPGEHVLTDVANGETNEEIMGKDNYIAMSEGSKHVFNLCNSIIGVSLLAMPFCFKRCGIILGIVMVMASSFLTRFTSHLLMKASLLCRKSNYEVLALHAYGPYGKLGVETSIICFMLGVLTSFFVIIGDIAPDIVLELTGIQPFPALRIFVLIAIALAVLPLGLLRNLSSLGVISTMAMTFYGLLALKIVSDALPVLTSEDWAESVLWWEPKGILVCLPIFSLALACQTQLFEVYDVLHEPSLGKMNKLVKQAVNICAAAYIVVGFFGYIAFYNTDFAGNILMAMQPSLMSQMIKLAFAASVVCSMPLVVFPCRTSLYSLLFRRNYSPIDVGATRATSDYHFRVLSAMIVVFTLIMGILFPNIELVLELNGSTIGTIICLIFPAILFIRVTSRNTFERTGAQLVFCAGIFILVVCTYVTLRNASQPIAPVKPAEDVIAEPMPREDRHLEPLPSLDSGIPELRIKSEGPAHKIIKPDQDSVKLKEMYELPKFDKSEPEKKSMEKPKEEVQYVRQEPPIPQEPEVVKAVKEEKKAVKTEERNEEPVKREEPKKVEKKPEPIPVVTVKSIEDKPVDVGAKKTAEADAKQEELIQKLQAQQEEQKKLIQEQKQLLEELKAHKDTHFNKVEPSPISDKSKAHDKSKSPVLPNIVLQPGGSVKNLDGADGMEEAVPLPIKNALHQNNDVLVGNDKAKLDLSIPDNKITAPVDRADNIDVQNKVVPQQPIPLVKQDQEVKYESQQHVNNELPAPTVRQSLLIPLVKATNASKKVNAIGDKSKTVTQVVLKLGQPPEVKQEPVVLQLGHPADLPAGKEDRREEVIRKEPPPVKKLDEISDVKLKKDAAVAESVGSVQEQQSQDNRAEIRKREAAFPDSDNNQLPVQDENCARSTEPPYGCKPQETNKRVQVQADKLNSQTETNKMVLSNTSKVEQQPLKDPPSLDVNVKLPSNVHSIDAVVNSQNNMVQSSDLEPAKLKPTTSAHRILAKDEQR